MQTTLDGTYQEIAEILQLSEANARQLVTCAHPAYGGRRCRQCGMPDRYGRTSEWHG